MGISYQTLNVVLDALDHLKFTSDKMIWNRHDYQYNLYRNKTVPKAFCHLSIASPLRKQVKMNCGENEQIVNLVEILQSSAMKEEPVEVKDDDLFMPHEGTFFTEGILNTQLTSDEDLTKVPTSEPDRDSNFQTALFEDIKQPTLISTTVQDFIKPAVNFKLEKFESTKKAKSAPAKKMPIGNKSSQRPLPEQPDKSK